MPNFGTEPPEIYMTYGDDYEFNAKVAIEIMGWTRQKTHYSMYQPYMMVDIWIDKTSKPISALGYWSVHPRHPLPDFKNEIKWAWKVAERMKDISGELSIYLYFLGQLDGLASFPESEAAKMICDAALDTIK